MKEANVEKTTLGGNELQTNSVGRKEHKTSSGFFHSWYTQTRATRARESSVTHKSAITDHAVEDNHVIDWDKANRLVYIAASKEY